MSLSALPPMARWLGYLGLLPFLALSAVVVLDPGAPLQAEAVGGLIAYGAAILSFLGAVHWGLLLARPAESGDPAAYVAGVVPAAVAAVALRLPAPYGLGVLVLGFGGFWLYEHRTGVRRLLPVGYLSMRRTLTLVVLACLVLALFRGAGA
jgi:hypothetical protein